MKEIYLAGGCFWGMEHLYRSFSFVKNVTSGYANINDGKDAKYETVCTKETGARETVKVEYDEAVSIETILDIYFSVIDPTVENRQGNDIGSQYQCGIYWTNNEDKEKILAFTSIEKTMYPAFKVELKELENFYLAEEYHQRYLEKNPGGYCHIERWKVRELVKKYDRIK